MKQATLSVALEVQPQSADRLSGLIETLRRDEEVETAAYPAKYDRLKTRVPTLHFMSLSVFTSANYDPIFVLEANFDGPSGVFWGQLEAALGAPLRDMLRCCKAPAGRQGALFRSITDECSRAPIAPYFEARALRPSVFHHGNRGLDRDRILKEGALFLKTRTELAQRDAVYRAMTAPKLHLELRSAMKAHFPWLDETPAPRIPLGERLGDWLRLVGFAFVVLASLSLPGMAVAFIALWPRFLIVTAVLCLLIGFFLYRMRNVPSRGTAPPDPPRGSGPVPTRMRLGQVIRPLAIAGLALAIYVAVASVAAALLAILITGRSFNALWTPSLQVVALGLVSALFVVVPALALWLRWLELRDSSQDAPPVDPSLLAEMAKREDRIPQNHMGSLVLVKPGILRAALFRTGHVGLGLYLRVMATDGYLGSMRTIHFAHWAFVDNGARLLFLSNFDHSWESYLDDFIEKAHEGLTFAWSSGVGFPPARFLFLDGAVHGRKFKAWARHSMAVSRFWFSAYRNYTVDQIERHARIAEGLRKATLTEKEAIAWTRHL